MAASVTPKVPSRVGCVGRGRAARMRAMRALAPILVLACALLGPFPLRAEEAGGGDAMRPPGRGAPLTVEVGTQRVVEATGARRVSIGNPAVADVQVLSRRQLLLTGLSPGRTSLTVFYERSEETIPIVVVATNRLKAARALVTALGLERAIAIRALHDGTLVATGRIDRVDELEAYLRLRRELPGLVDFVRVEGGVFAEIAQTITAALHAHGITTARASHVAGTVFLEGTVADEVERDRALRIARAIHQSIVARLE